MLWTPWDTMAPMAHMTSMDPMKPIMGLVVCGAMGPTGPGSHGKVSVGCRWLRFPRAPFEGISVFADSITPLPLGPGPQARGLLKASVQPRRPSVSEGVPVTPSAKQVAKALPKKGKPKKKPAA